VVGVVPAYLLIILAVAGVKSYLYSKNKLQKRTEHENTVDKTMSNVARETHA
jgi:uncharacterized protein YpmB